MRGLTTLLPLVLLMVAMYFLLFRPQQKRMAEHQRLVRSIDVGDEIVTSAGIFGKITRMTEERVEIELSGGSRLEMLRSSIVRRVGDVDEEHEAVEAAKSGEKPKDDGARSDEDESLE